MNSQVQKIETYSQWGARVQDNLFKGQTRNFTTQNQSAPFKVTGNAGKMHENFFDIDFAKGSSNAGINT